jgi:equilibrative nucleoside transporter 1/2/3
MEEKTNEPSSTFMNKVIFIFFGIASLLVWNALLTKLDFFNFFLSDIKPFRSFSFLNYFLNITFQFILIWKKNLMPLKSELITGILGSIVFLILLPLSASQLGQNEMKNKVITAGLVVLMGFINALASGGFFGYAGHFPLEMIVLFTVGQGLSAVLMNILEYIVLASVHIKEKEKKKSLLELGYFLFLRY